MTEGMQSDGRDHVVGGGRDHVVGGGSPPKLSQVEQGKVWRAEQKEDAQYSPWDSESG